MEKVEANYEMGGHWGNAIQWSTEPEWNELNDNRKAKVVGWKQRKPKVGETLMVECQRSWLIFEFKKIEHCGDPPDMFFADVEIIRQVMKFGGRLS